MTKLLWCSAHTPTKEQLNELEIIGKLTFLKDINPSLQEKINNCPSDRTELTNMCWSLGALGKFEEFTLVQLGGSPLFLMIAGQLLGGDVSVIFADSERISEDIPQADGSIKKISTFRHKGFI